jgi:hypothetical protein
MTAAPLTAAGRARQMLNSYHEPYCDWRGRCVCGLDDARAAIEAEARAPLIAALRALVAQQEELLRDDYGAAWEEALTDAERQARAALAEEEK